MASGADDLLDQAQLRDSLAAATDPTEGFLHSFGIFLQPCCVVSLGHFACGQREGAEDNLHFGGEEFVSISFEEAGKQLIEVNDQLGSVIVRGAAPPTEQTPLPADDNEPSTPTGEVAEVTEPDITNDTTTTSSWPIVVGVLGGCLVLAAIALYVIKRKQHTTPENPTDAT